MEARGFGGGGPRSWGRPSRFGWREVLLVGVGAGIAAASVLAATLTGQWAFIDG
jgi:energy-coupling factor transport system permease protein